MADWSTTKYNLASALRDFGSSFKENAIKALLDEHQFDAPKVLVNEEISGY